MMEQKMYINIDFIWDFHVGVQWSQSLQAFQPKQLINYSNE